MKKTGKILGMPNRGKTGENAPGKTVCRVIFRTNVMQIEQQWRLLINFS